MSPSSRSDEDRPTSPDPLILDEAAASLQGVGETLEWHIGERIVRPGSTVFAVQAHISPDHHVGAFYKVSTGLSPEPTARQLRRVERARAGFERSLQLERALAPRLEGEGIVFSRTLAVDPRRMIVVTSAVPGEPLGKPLRHGLTAGRRETFELWLKKAGRAARLIEDCTLDPVTDGGVSIGERWDGDLLVDEVSEAKRWDRRLQRAGPVITRSSADRIDRRWRDLLTDAMGRSRAVSFAHGDLSSSNLLVGEELGIIDFAWVPRLRGFDIAHLAYRLEFDDPIPAQMAATFVRSLLEGYGDEAAPASSAWKYHRLGFLLKVLIDDRRGLRRPRWFQRKRALSEVEAILS